MRRFSNGCGRHRANICLLAAGALAGEETAAVKNHLATCSNCQSFYAEVKRVTLPLAEWEKTFSHVEANQTVQARWAKSFSTATETAHPSGTRLFSILDWANDIFRPCYRIWAGFAAVWLAIAVINFSIHEPANPQAGKASRPSPEIVRAYLEGENFLADWNRLENARITTPQKQPPPQPRSERHPQIIRS
jgi:anti-sigma factor RsiW